MLSDFLVVFVGIVLGLVALAVVAIFFGATLLVMIAPLMERPIRASLIGLAGLALVIMGVGFDYGIGERVCLTVGGSGVIVLAFNHGRAKPP